MYSDGHLQISHSYNVYYQIIFEEPWLRVSIQKRGRKRSLLTLLFEWAVSSTDILTIGKTAITDKLYLDMTHFLQR